MLSISQKAWLECLVSNKCLSFSGIHGEPGIKRSKVIPVQSVTANFTKVVALCIFFIQFVCVIHISTGELCR